jgi:hypothetical protein
LVTGSLHECLFKSRLIILKMRNISDEAVEKIKTHNLCSINLFSESHSVYKVIWKKHNALLRSHCNNSYAKEPQCNVMRTLTVFSIYINFNELTTLRCTEASSVWGFKMSVQCTESGIEELTYDWQPVWFEMQQLFQTYHKNQSISTLPLIHARRIWYRFRSVCQLHTPCTEKLLRYLAQYNLPIFLS